MPRDESRAKQAPPPLFYLDLFTALQKAKVNYLVVGGVALVLHGAVRFTADLDLMVALEENNLKRFIAEMTTLKYRPKAPVAAGDLANRTLRESWIKEKHMKVFSFFDSKMQYQLVDIFVYEPIPFHAAYSRRKIVGVGKTRIPIMAIPDLIALKRISARPQDLEDINTLKAIFKSKKKAHS